MKTEKLVSPSHPVFRNVFSMSEQCRWLPCMDSLLGGVLQGWDLQDHSLWVSKATLTELKWNKWLVTVSKGLLCHFVPCPPGMFSVLNHFGIKMTQTVGFSLEKFFFLQRKKFSWLLWLNFPYSHLILSNVIPFPWSFHSPITLCCWV